MIDQAHFGVLAVDVVSGDRVLLSSAVSQVGSGPGLAAPRDLLRDEATGTLYVLDQNSQGFVIAVDATTGDRSAVASRTLGSGPTPPNPTGFGLDGANQRLLIVDAQSGELVAVDIASGDRVILASPDVGAGPFLETAASVAIDPATGTILFGDSRRDAILAIEPNSGDRVTFSR